MERRLKDTIDKAPLLASYPISFIHDTIENHEDAKNALFNAIKLLRQISDDETKLPEFYEAIDKDDFFKIKLFLTERLYVLEHL